MLVAGIGVDDGSGVLFAGIGEDDGVDVAVAVEVGRVVGSGLGVQAASSARVMMSETMVGMVFMDDFPRTITILIDFRGNTG